MKKFPLFLGLAVILFGAAVLVNIAPVAESVVVFLFLTGGGALVHFGREKFNS